MDSQEKTLKNPLEDQRRSALEHYEQASKAVHHWSSFVESAIKAYSPESCPPPVSAEVVSQLRREETEIRDDAHLMHAEGTSDTPVTEAAVIEHLKNEGWEAYDIDTWHDNTQYIYRWVCSIRKPITEIPAISNCPFCGGESELILRGNNATKKRFAEIECKQCHTKQVTGAIRNSLEWCKEKAIEKWNKRLSTPPQEPSAKADDMERLKNKLADDFRKNYTLDLNAEGAAEEGFKAGWDKLLVLLQNQPSAKAIAETAKNTCDIPGCKKIAPQNDIFCKDHRY